MRCELIEYNGFHLHVMHGDHHRAVASRPVVASVDLSSCSALKSTIQGYMNYLLRLLASVAQQTKVDGGRGVGFVSTDHCSAEH
jgi:hypothetical protein